jgi:hypothetical protein
MPTLTEVVVHERRTRRSEYTYQSTPKHHGADATAAQWLPALTLDQEFDVFDFADEHELSDDRDRLYGLRLDQEGGLHYIGVWHEQVAEFRAKGGRSLARLSGLSAGR